MALPSCFKKVVREIQGIVDNPGCLEIWQTRIQEWDDTEASKQVFEKTGEKIWVRVKSGYFIEIEKKYMIEPDPIVPLKPTLAYKYALLGALSDADAECDQTATILGPFPEGHYVTKPGVNSEQESHNKKLHNDAFVKGVVYTALKIRVKEGIANGKIPEEEAERFDEFLTDIRRDCTATNKRRGGTGKNPVGHPKPSEQDEYADEQISDKWKRRHEGGTSKADYAKENNMEIEKLDRILDRVDKRKKRADSSYRQD